MRCERCGENRNIFHPYCKERFGAPTRARVFHIPHSERNPWGARSVGPDWRFRSFATHAEAIAWADQVTREDQPMTIPDYEPRADEGSIPLSPGMVLCPCGWTYEGDDTLTAYVAHTEEAHR